MSKSSGYLPTLDGWRALAVLGVIFGHAELAWRGMDVLPPWARYLIGGSSTKGVQLFFAISGFLITSRLVEEWHGFGRISLKRFYVRRAFRILPPALTYLAILSILGMASVVALPRGSILSCLLFFRNYWTVQCTTTGHFWSLSIEEQFYLIWPGILVAAGLRRSKYAASAMILAIVAWRWIAFCQPRIRALLHGDFWGRSDICFDGLLAGCLVAVLLDSPLFRKYSAKCLTPRVVVGTILLILVTAGSTYTPAGRTLQSVLMPLIVVATVLNPGTRLGRFLENRALRWIGRLSYSLYIWQEIFLFLGEKRMGWYPLRFIGLLAVATLSFYFVERPMVKLGYRLAPPPSLGHPDLVSEPVSRSVPAGILSYQKRPGQMISGAPGVPTVAQ